MEIHEDPRCVRIAATTTTSDAQPTRSQDEARHMAYRHALTNTFLSSSNVTGPVQMHPPTALLDDHQ